MPSPKAAPATTTQIQKTELPGWVNEAAQQNYGAAVEVANRPYQGFMGERVAPP